MTGMFETVNYSLNKQFKNKSALENYLIVTPNSENRKLITKFRCSDHELMIKEERHKKIDVEERLCCVCAFKKIWKMSYISYWNALLIIEL